MLSMEKVLKRLVPTFGNISVHNIGKDNCLSQAAVLDLSTNIGFLIIPASFSMPEHPHLLSSMLCTRSRQLLCISPHGPNKESFACRREQYCSRFAFSGHSPYINSDKKPFIHSATLSLIHARHSVSGYYDIHRIKLYFDIYYLLYPPLTTY